MIFALAYLIMGYIVLISMLIVDSDNIKRENLLNVISILLIGPPIWPIAIILFIMDHEAGVKNER